MIRVGKIEKYINDEIGRKGGLLFALIDPLDYKSEDDAVSAGAQAADGGADVILVGGSMGVQGELLDSVVRGIKERISIPLVLFPGNISTVTKYADAVYFMSLLNSRNPYWISGAQMLAAHTVRNLGIEALPVGYIVIAPGGTVGWVGDAKLVPRDKPQIAAGLALAAQMCGFRFVLTDCGSNPKEGHMPLEMVSAVAKSISIPYIVAGGIRTPDEAKSVVAAGACAIQVGTALQSGGNLKQRVSQMVRAVREGAKRRG
ncbi:MAG: geranylgeranylglyceryl/heptaprenylglyceryl phosphate synthase [Candidatus Micrarchaeota archaeon]|nr:geranylgeranylglyceryl/heptaprenylglyceryl phosphate synthase [Candidatus Micrarchaeota archaeon]